MERAHVGVAEHSIKSAKLAHAAAKLFPSTSEDAAHRKPPTSPRPEMRHASFEFRHTIHPNEACAICTAGHGDVVPHLR